jgi:hypothetical protein
VGGVRVEMQRCGATVKRCEATRVVGDDAEAEGRDGQHKVKEAENSSKRTNVLKKGDGWRRRRATSGGTATGSSGVSKVGVGGSR